MGHSKRYNQKQQYILLIKVKVTIRLSDTVRATIVKTKSYTKNCKIYM